jgi:hypothetical protein
MVLLIGARAGVYAADPESEQLTRAPQKEVVGRASEVEDRGSMQDQQGWGTNLSAVVNGPARGSAQAQLTYGDGLFGRRVSLDDQLRIYAHLDNTASQPGTAYHLTDYGSANLIWQLRKRLSVGAEGLYGIKETKDSSDGDVFRFGLLYSILD